MLSNILERRVRLYLKDLSSDIEQGEFWDWRAIELALNNSIDLLLNLALLRNDSAFLVGLVSETAYSNQADIALPADYLHFISASVGQTEDTMEQAKIYMGQDVDNYYTNEFTRGAFIKGNTLNFREKKIQSGGVLYYWKRPPLIKLDPTLTVAERTFDDTFDQHILFDIIPKQATVMLSFKETQTQRDFKTYRDNLVFIRNYPKNFLNYTTMNRRYNDGTGDTESRQDDSGRGQQ